VVITAELAPVAEDDMTASVDLFGNLGGTLHEAFAGVPETEPLAWDSSTGAALVLRHPDVETLAHDPRVVGIGLTFFDMMGITDGPLRTFYSGLMFTNDGEAHKRLRSLVARAFTPKSAQALRPTAAALAAAAMPDIAPGQSVDLVDVFAGLPTRVMCRLLGVPDEDMRTFSNWLDALSPIFLVMTPDQIAAATDAVVELLAYIDDLTTRRRASPGPDLLTALLAAEDAGDRMTHEEVVRMVSNLLIAGHDTTGSQIGCTLLSLHASGVDIAPLVLDDALLASVVTETTRLEPGIPVIPRTLRESVEVDGNEIPAGSMAMLCSVTANRDPSVWKDPDRFEPERFVAPGHPTMLAFGAGPHFCLGTALAKVTLEECVRAVAATGARYELVESPDEIPWRVVLGRTPERVLVSATRTP
jgi:cytochrome P450